MFDEEWVGRTIVEMTVERLKNHLLKAKSVVICLDLNTVLLVGILILVRILVTSTNFSCSQMTKIVTILVAVLVV